MRKKERLARVLGSRAAVRLAQQVFRGPSLLCLTYHRIANAVEHDPDVISATPAQLEAQAGWVREHFPVVSASTIVDVIGGRARLRTAAVAFTFDDGYADNFDAGVMLMERFGIAATFFVPTAYIETGVTPAWDRLGFAIRHSARSILHVPAIGSSGPWAVPLTDYGQAISRVMAAYRSLPAADRGEFVAACEAASGARSAPRSPFMSWAQIRQLREMGHEIGAHTHTHPVLAALSADEQRDELGRSKDILEHRLGATVPLVAYPYGKPGTTFSSVTKRIARACGFRAAFSFYGGCNRPGRIDPYDVKRIKVEPETSPAMFRARVATRGLAPV